MAGLVLLLALGGSARAVEPFRAPTPEELALKEVPGYPGASAVVLYREEICTDDIHVVEHYDRIKILTEKGKEYANVQLDYVLNKGYLEQQVGDDKKLGEIAGRTLHADGTIVPFTGKPYRKMVAKINGSQAEALIFTLPDVEVGSIIEYRYSTRTNLNIYEAPRWYIQGNLYVKAAHYEWSPTMLPLTDANDHGEVTGKIDMTYMGSSAVSWRHSALLGDNASLQNELRQSMERMLPKSLEVSVDGIENLQEYEKPLVITFKVEGKLGAVTGKRIVMPADLFLVGASATFPHEKRKQAVYFHYPHATQDAVRVNLPKGFTVEAAPVTAKLDLPARESYAMDVAVDSSGFTTRRNYLRTEVLVPVKDYEDLRKFYLQFETEDQENVVIKTPTAVVPQGE
jgi:hypothetical protein